MNVILAALINGAIASVLLTGAAWLVTRVTPDRLNAATRYLVWWTVLIMTVLLPLAYLPERLIPRVTTVPSQQVLPITIEPSEFIKPARPAPIPALAKPTAPVRSPWFPIRIEAGSAPQGAAAAWAIAAALMLLRLAYSWLVLRRRIAQSTEAPHSLSIRLDSWLRQCGSRRRLRIAVSDEVAMPMVAGLRRPSILLPASLLGALDEDELDQIGIHEVAHVTRGDDWALILQRILEALFPFHPVVRWVARRIDLEREIACDDFVVRAFGSPRPYAACLTRVAELTSGVRSSIVAAAVTDERSHLTRRVDMLLDKTRHRGTRPLKGPLAAVIILILVVTRVTAHTPGMIVFTPPAPRMLSPNAAAAPSVLGPTSTPVASAIPDPPTAGTRPDADVSLRSSGSAKSAASTLPLANAIPDPPAAGIRPDADVSLRPSGATMSAASTLPPEPVPLLSQVPGADVVRIPVVVREPRNRFVIGLDKQNFRLFEDGVEQTVTQVQSRPCAALGLLISTSESTDPKRAQMRAAFQEFARLITPMSEFSVFEAGTIAGSSAAIDSWIAGLRPVPDSRKVILVITDAGSGESSSDSAARLADEQRRIAAFVPQDVLVYALNIAYNKEAPARLFTESTAQTGGQLLTVGADSVVTAASGIGAEVQNMYELAYSPKNTAHGGAYRTVRVELIQPRGLPPLTLNYRPGYYEP